MMARNDLYTDFLHLEEKLHLFHAKVDGTRFWERLRFPVYRALLERRLEGSRPQTKEMGGLRKLRRFVTSFFKLSRNILLAPRSDVLFVCSSRRLLEEDGLWWDIYTDPIIDGFKSPPLAVETHFSNIHYGPAKTPRLYYLDFIEFLTFLKRSLRIAVVRFTKEEIDLLREIRKGILRTFGVELDIESMTRRILEERRARLPIFVRMLKRVQPKVVVLAQGYAWEDLIETCKSLGITSVELQHGMISPNDVAYSYSGENRTKETFADYLIVWGDHWKSITVWPLREDHVVSAGFPYLDDKKNSYLETVKKKQILFISQETTGRVLSRFALELSQVQDLDHEIVYKLHPRERYDWKQRYPWLIDSDVRVVEKKRAVLYDLFAESAAVVGVYSTAIIEGLAFGLPTYLVTAPGLEHMRTLLEAGVLEEVSSVEELLQHISTSEGAGLFRTDHFFKPNATVNITSFLIGLVQKKHVGT